MSAIDSFGSFLPRKNSNGSENMKLQKLRYHLAVEGCSHSQLSLARSFLQDAAETEVERKENAELAVRWLLLATSEGNSEAFQLLENCYKMGVGVTAGNREHVEQCLRSTNEEKLAHRIGCNLFRLIAFDTREAIPLDYFQQRISLFLADEIISEDQTLNTESTTYSSSEYITVQEVVKSVHSCLLGECPKICLQSKFQSYHLDSASSDNFFKLFFRYLRDIMKIYSTSIEIYCFTLAELPLCLNFMVFLLAVVFTTTIFFTQSQQTVLLLLEHIAVYYVFLIVIVISARMARSDKKKRNRDRWEEIIRRFDNSAADEIPHHGSLQLFSNFILFFTTVLIFVTFNQSQVDNLIIFGKWTLLSFCFVKADMGRSSALSNIFLFLSLILALTRLGGVCHDESFSWLSTNLFSVCLPVADQILSVQPLSLISCLAFVVYLILFCSGSFNSSLNALTTCMWFHVAFKDVHHVITTVFCHISISLVIPCIKKLGACSTVFIVFFAVQCITFSDFFLSFLFMVAFVLSAKLTTVIILLKEKYGISSVQVYGVLVLLTAPCCAFMLPSSTGILSVGKPENITWSRYSRLCHRHAWSETNMVHTQVGCDKYKGWTIHFEGNVANVFRKKIVSLGLPQVLGFQLGKTLLINSYEVTLHIKGTFSVEAEIFVQTNDVCKDFIFDIQEGDLLSVIGSLQDGLGTNKPVVTLMSADCISCMENIHCTVNTPYWFEYAIPRLAEINKYFLYPWIK